jgi:hypothetical protein
MATSWHFGVFVLASIVVFLGILRWVVRRRVRMPSARTYGWLTAVVVVAGMILAKAGAAIGLPWWIYYGVPAAVTWCLPPLALRMRTRETVEYLVLAALMAPAVHIFFSLSFGWSEYLPFIPIPSLRELLNG